VSAKRTVKNNDQDTKKMELTSKKMPLQVLGVEVRLGAVRARELSVGILLGNLGLRDASSGSWRRRTARGTWEDSPTALRTNHMGWLLTLRRKHRRLRHHGTLSVGRVHALLGDLHAGSGHRPKNRRHAPCLGSRCDRLRVNRSRGCLRHHARSRRVLLLLLVRVGHHLLIATTLLLLLLLLLLRGRGRIRRHVGRSNRRVRGGRGPRSVRVATVWVATVRVLHGLVLRWL
jgi:hypothetical protein